jgi:hypothetical protein
MSTTRVFDPDTSWRPLEDRMRREQDPSRRALLEQVRNHMRSEIQGRFDELMETPRDGADVSRLRATGQNSTQRWSGKRRLNCLSAAAYSSYSPRNRHREKGRRAMFDPRRHLAPITPRGDA